MGVHGRAELMMYHEASLSPAERELVSFELREVEDRLFDAVDSGDLEVVRYLLDAGADPDWMNSFTRERVLSAAVGRGRLDVAKLARAYGAELIDTYEGAPAANQPSEQLFAASSGETYEWLCSGPPADRSTAPPPSQPFAASEELCAVVRKWRQLKQQEPYETLVEKVLSRGLIDIVDYSKATAAARVAQISAPALVVHPVAGLAIHPGHQDLFPASTARWRQHALIVGRCAVVLQDLYTEVAFRPQHSGAKRALESFEMHAGARDEETLVRYQLDTGQNAINPPKEGGEKKTKTKRL